MGMDQSLCRSIGVKNLEDIPEEKRYIVTVTRNGKPHPHIDPARVVQIVEEMGVWRKDYFVQDWFESNVANSSRGNWWFEALPSHEELGKLLTKVNEELAPEAGASEYFRRELLHTKAILESALTDEFAHFEYHANW